VDQRIDPGTLPIEPDDHLRDMLILIAKETVEIHRKISPSSGTKPWSVVDVSYSESHTWNVYVREVGAKRGFTVEIDLNKTMDRQQTGLVDEEEAFPVRIWF
jgi:hypothetical protein